MHTLNRAKQSLSAPRTLPELSSQKSRRFLQITVPQTEGALLIFVRAKVENSTWDPQRQSGIGATLCQARRWPGFDSRPDQNIKEEDDH